MVKIVSFSKTDEQFISYGERGIQKRIDAGDMTPADGDLIREFVGDLSANNNIGVARAYKITNALSNLSRFIKTPFLDNQIRDLHAAANAIKTGEKMLAENQTHVGKLSKSTQRDYIIFLKRFYLWMLEEGKIDLPYDKVKKIKAPSPDKMTKTAEQMLSEDEIRAMIHSCDSSTAIRDKALISTLYESGMRIHEVALLKWSDLKFDRYFVKLNTAGKTGTPRYIPLTASRTYLVEWRSVYPETAEGTAPVFITKSGKTFQYNYTKNMLKKIAQRAGVQKSVTPHLFRHSRITNMIRQGFSESIIKMMMWGSLSSEQLSTYTHLQNNDIDAEIAKRAGICIDENAPVETFTTRICSRCNHVNAPDINFCGVCGLPLDESTAQSIEELSTKIEASMMKKLQEDPEQFKQIVEQFL